MRGLLSILLCLVVATALHAQPAPVRASFDSTDAKGRRTGMWILQQPARMGEPGYTEFGRYDAGRKTGAWYKLDGEGNVAAIEHFRNDMLSGEVKYFEKGVLTVTGFYHALNPAFPFDTIYVTDPLTLQEKRRVIPTDRGTLRDSTWRYYDATSGRLMREEFWSYDDLVSKKNFSSAVADSTTYRDHFTPMPTSPSKYYKPPRGKSRSNTE